jgi:hypothetical protein
MKWISGETINSRRDRKKKWHKWFAWYPVVVDWITVEGRKRKVKVWLSYIDRCIDYDGNRYYREILEISFTQREA